MITENAIENLGLLADHAEREARRLESLPVAGGDYEAPHSLLPNQLSAPEYLRKRAAAYRAAAKEMREMKQPVAEWPKEEPSIGWRAAKDVFWGSLLALVFVGAGFFIAMGVMQ